VSTGHSSLAMVDEAMREWRLGHALSFRFALPSTVCPPGECAPIELLPSARLWGCPQCLRTHLCDPDVEECPELVTREYHRVCSWTAAETGADHARYAGYTDWEQHRDDRMDDLSHEEEEGADIKAMLHEAVHDYEYAQRVPGDVRNRKKVDDTLAGVRGLAHEFQESKRAERHRAAAELFGRKGVSLLDAPPPPPAVADEEAPLGEHSDSESDSDEDDDRARLGPARGFTVRDLTCVDRLVMPLDLLKSFVGGLDLYTAFARPSKTDVTGKRERVQWLRRPNRNRRRFLTAFSVSVETLVARAWLSELAHFVKLAAIDLGVIDMLARWMALVHITAPKTELPPLRVLGAYVLRFAQSGVEVRDGLGTTWWIVRKDPTTARRSALLFEPPPAAPGKRKRGEELPRQRYRSLFLANPETGFTVIQLDEVWQRLSNVIQGAYFTAPWYWDWFTLPSRRCYSPDTEGDGAGMT